MKVSLAFIIFLLISNAQLFGQQNAKIRFDGVYGAKNGVRVTKKGKDSLISYLRFYPGDTVLTVTISAGVNVKDLKKWFNKETYTKSYDCRGIYQIKHDTIYFTTSWEHGTTQFKGKIVNDNALILDVKSLINAHDSTYTYCFIKN